MNVIVLEEWLPVRVFPLLFFSGVLLQTAWFFCRRRGLFFAGIVFVLSAAALDRDLALAVGQVLAAIGIHIFCQDIKG
jgi:hypothetical protein